jgi:hypothetical protein
VIGTVRPAAAAKDDSMDQNERNVGRANPNAPALARFAFLIGDWRGEATFTSPDGGRQRFAVTWLGRYILDGYAIADDYRMTDPSGKLVVLGTNFRTYDAVRQEWNIRWLNALAGTWTELVPNELGGIHFDGPSVTYAFKEPAANPGAYTRATYTNVSETHFTWRGEQSDDAKSWTDFMVVELDRRRD